MATDTFKVGGAVGAAVQIAFVFDNVANYQSLVSAFRADVEVHVLDATQDGLAQIAAILEGRSDVEALHVVGHGSEGSLNFGSLTLDAGNAGAYSDVLDQIGAALSADGDILLYGCDVAADAPGAQFVGRIAQATGADVAASTDPTGSAARGGDWTLEYSQGAVAATSAFDTSVVRSIDTLLALPNGVQDVTPSMNVGNFIPGFTLSSTAPLVPNDDPYGIYVYSTADQDTSTKDATLTVAADNLNLGSFDLTGISLPEYPSSDGIDGSYLITVTGYKLDGTTVTTTFHNQKQSLNYDILPDYSQFNGITKFDIRMQAELYAGQWLFPVSNLTFDSFTIANALPPNAAPIFVGASTPLSATQNDAAIDVTTLLHVSDTDSGQTLTWSQQTAPSHGALSFSSATASSGGTNITPGGTITYTPTAGFSGTDSFTVKVFDGFSTVTRTITVNVTPDQPSAPDLTGASDSGTSSSDNLTNASTLSFSGSGAAGDSSSTVRVFIDKNGNGAYDAGTDVSATATMSNGSWTVSNLSTSGLANGTYNVYAQTTASDGTATSVSSTSLSVTLDQTAPALAISTDKSALKMGETATVTFTFSENPGSSFTLADVIVTGGTLSALSGSGFTRTAIFTPNANTNGGTASITVASGTYTDAAGNTGGAGAAPSLVFDTKAPTLTITSSTAVLKAGETATITFTFSEDPGSSFNWDGSAGDLVVTGGTLSAISGSGFTRTAIFTPNANTNAGTASITVASGSYLDAAGNNGGAGISPSLTFDTKAPTATITIGDSSLMAGETSLVTITFSEPVLGFGNADLTIANGTLSPVTSSDGGRTWIATFTPHVNVADASNVIVLTTSGVADAVGNAGSGTVTSANYMIDTVRPTAAIVLADATLTAGETSTVTITFSEPVTGFSNADLTVANGTLGEVVSHNGGVTWTATFTPHANVTDTTNVITLDNTGYTGSTGNTGSGVTSSTNYAIDTARPTATIELADTVLTVGESALVTISFSEPVSGFSNADLTVANGTLGEVVSHDGGVTWTATFTPHADLTDASNVIILNTSGVTDAAGNTGSGTVTSPNYIIDQEQPTATSITLGSSTIKAGETTSVTIVFSEVVTGLTTDDLDVQGGSLSGLSTSDGITWTATFTPIANLNAPSNVIALSVAGVTDIAGNSGAGITTSANYAVHTTRPMVSTITLNDLVLKSGETTQIDFSFSEPVTGLTLDDLTVEGGTLSNLTSTDGGQSWTVTYTPNLDTERASNRFTVNEAGVTNADGNAGVGVLSSTSFAVDTRPPTLAITTDRATLKAGETTLVTFTFSEQVVGFSNEDLWVTNGMLSPVASTDGGRTWTAIFTPSADTNGGVASITVAPSSYADGVGNAGSGGATPGLVFDTLAPAAPSTPDLAPASDTGASNTDNLTSSTIPTFIGTAEAGATIKLYDGATLVGTGTADGAGHWSITSSVLSAGMHSITVVATDAAGNVGPASGVLEITVDATAPTAPGVALASDTGTPGDGSTSNGTVSVSGLEPGATWQYSLDGGDSWAAGSGTSFVLPSGSYTAGTVQVRQTDAAGNSSLVGVLPQAVSVDSAVDAPTLSLASDSGATTDRITNSGVVNVGGLEAAASWQYSTNGGSTWTTGTGTSLTVTGEGDHSVVVRQIDQAGNMSAPSETLTFILDTVRPTVTVTMSDQELKAGETAIVTFTFSEVPAGFTTADVTVENGTLSNLAVSSGDPRVYTAVFTPTANIKDTSNIIAIGSAWTDVAGNAAASGTESGNYEIDTIMVDGVSIDREVVDNGDGTSTQVVTIPVVTGGRTETDGSAGYADIPLVTVGGRNALSVQLGVGIGLTASGFTAPKAAGSSLTDLIREISAHTPAGSADQTALTGGGSGFLASLPTNQPLLVQTIVATQSGTTSGVPLVISGSSDPAAPATALVIDARGLAAGTVIELQNVAFATVIGNVRVTGGAGSQVVYGDGASQRLVLGADDDTLHGGAGNDYVGSLGGNDWLYGDAGNDTVTGGIGNDRLFGGSDNDRLEGGSGNDTLEGGTGADLLSGGIGNDTYYVDHAGDRVNESGGQGTDTIYASVSYALSSSAAVEVLRTASSSGTQAISLTGSNAANTLYGNAGTNKLSGGAGDDKLYGYGGNDTLRGDSGNDWIVGGLGQDMLWGGAGADVFDFNSVLESRVGSQCDVIYDFQSGQDVIDLRGIDANELRKGDQAFTWIVTKGAFLRPDEAASAFLNASFTGRAGELRYDKGILMGDTDGDRKADFQIKIIGAFSTGDVLL